MNRSLEFYFPRTQRPALPWRQNAEKGRCDCAFRSETPCLPAPSLGVAKAMLPPSCSLAWDKTVVTNRGSRYWARKNWLMSVCQGQGPRKLSAFAWMEEEEGAKGKLVRLLLLLCLWLLMEDLTRRERWWRFRMVTVGRVSQPRDLFDLMRNSSDCSNVRILAHIRFLRGNNDQFLHWIPLLICFLTDWSDI